MQGKMIMACIQRKMINTSNEKHIHYLMNGRKVTTYHFHLTLTLTLKHSKFMAPTWIK